MGKIMKKKINFIKLISIMLLVTLTITACGNVSSNEKKLRKAFGITHSNEATIIADSISKANLGNIEDVVRDKNSSENKFIIYMDDDSEYILYLSNSYGMQALINKDTNEIIYSAIQ